MVVVVSGVNIKNGTFTLARSKMHVHNFIKYNHPGSATNRHLPKGANTTLHTQYTIHHSTIQNTHQGMRILANCPLSQSHFCVKGMLATLFSSA